MKSLLLIAHAQEVHSGPWASFWHALGDWRTGVPFFAIFLPAVIAVIYLLVQRSKAITLLISAGVLFLIGLLAFQYTTNISIVAFTIGIACLLANILIVLQNSSMEAPPDEDLTAHSPTKKEH